MTLLPPLVPGFTLSEWFPRAELVLLSPVRVCCPVRRAHKTVAENLDFIVCIKSLVFSWGYFRVCILTLPLKFLVKLLAGLGDLSSSCRNQTSQAPR